MDLLPYCQARPAPWEIQGYQGYQAFRESLASKGTPACMETWDHWALRACRDSQVSAAPKGRKVTSIKWISKVGRGNEAFVAPQADQALQGGEERTVSLELQVNWDLRGTALPGFLAKEGF